MFFVVRLNDSFNFPLGLIKYIVIIVITEYLRGARKVTTELALSMTSSIIRERKVTAVLKTLSIEKGEKGDYNAQGSKYDKGEKGDCCAEDTKYDKGEKSDCRAKDTMIRERKVTAGLKTL